MALLGFKTQFVPFILNGSKQHTIRATRKNPPQAGQLCHCYTGLCTKNCRLLGRWPCIKVEPITIQLRRRSDIVGNPATLNIWIGDYTLDYGEKSALAWRDGFRPEGSSEGAPGDSLGLMTAFWIKENGVESADFEGTIIHWRYSKP